jgi:hypothetical protein
MGANTKRSLVIEGRKTSVALEKKYWEGLAEIADSEGRSLTMMIEEIGKLAISPHPCSCSSYGTFGASSDAAHFTKVTTGSATSSKRGTHHS